MSGEEITFPISAPGAEKAARQFEQLAKSAENAAKKADLLGAEAAAAAANVAKLEGTAAAAGKKMADQLAVSAEKAAIKAQNLGTAADVAGRKLEEMGGKAAKAAVVAEMNFQKLNRAGSGAAATFSALGRSLGDIDARFAQFGTAVGRAGGAISGMSAIIAGPWGLAIGGAIAAVGLLTEYLDANAKAAKRNALALLEAEEAAREFDRDPDAYLRRNPRTGLNATQQYLLDKLNDEEALAGATGAIGADIGRGNDRRGAGPEFEAMQRRTENERRISQLSRLEGDSRARAGRFGERETWMDARRGGGEQQLRKMESATKSSTENMISSWRALQGAGVEAMSAIGATGVQALNKMAQGYRVTFNQMRAAIGDILVAQGTKWLFEGIGMGIISAGLNPQSEALIALGTGEIAVGMAIGARSAPSGRGGGGGGRARPYVPAAEAGTGGGGGGTTIVNLNYTTQLAPSAQDGERAYRGIQRAQAQGLIPKSS